MLKSSRSINYDDVFLFSYSLYLIRFLWISSINWNDRYKYMISMLGLCLYLVNLAIFVVMLLFLKGKINFKWVLAIGIYSICMFLSYRHSGSTDLLFTSLFTLFAYGLSAKKMIKCSFSITALTPLICFLAMAAHLASDRVIPFDYGYGHSLGIAHPNTLSAIVLSAIVQWEILYNDMKLNWKLFALFSLSGIVVWRITLSRTGAYLIFAFPVLLAIIRMTAFFNSTRVLKLLRVLILAMLLVSFVLMTNAELQSKIGDFGFKFRFAYPYRIYKQYGLHAFGNNYSIISSVFKNSIDSSYLHMLLYCGYVPTLLVVAMIVWICGRCYKTQLYPLLAIAVIYILQGVTEQYMIRISMNCMYLFALSDLDICENEINQVLCRNSISESMEGI